MKITVNDYYKSIFHSKTYKLSLSGGCTCPTRDGTLGTGGCIFCSASGSGDFTPGVHITSVKEQVSSAKAIVAPKLKGQPAKYIAYFQSFTNTYGDFSRLKKNWEEALSCKDIVGLALGTRPDCLSEECLAYLGELAEKTYVQVELGFQTASEETEVYIRRGFKNSVYVQAVEKLHEANPRIHVVTHVIFGLPGEGRGEMMESVRQVVSAASDGIKITCLYVLKGTDLEADYEAGRFNALAEDDYFSLLEEALKIIPDKIIIHRLTGDPPKSLLIAPKWTTNKKEVLTRVNNLLSLN